MPIFTRQRAREANELREQEAMGKPTPKLRRNLASGYIKRSSPVKSWKVKMIKELNKPIKPKPSKDFWVKKIFGDVEINRISYQDKANKFWATKERSVILR